MLDAVWMGEELDQRAKERVSYKKSITLLFPRLEKAFSQKSNLSSRFK